MLAVQPFATQQLSGRTRLATGAVPEQTQNETLELTPWMEWFLGCRARVIDGAETALAAVLAPRR